MTKRTMLLAGCVAPFFLGMGSAQAQDTPQKPDTPQKAATSQPAPELGDIVVTAQRRVERLQDVPITVSAFNDAAMAQLHLADTLTVSKFVPGMISQHNAGLASANGYYLRGLGNGQSIATVDSPVTTYVDDVYIARQNANNYAFFDTERVEVLRGPQGTLFGRNTTGGAINVIMRKPADRFGLKMEATAGSYNRYTVKGSVDAPLSDKVLTKFSAYYVTDQGYLKNITTGDHLSGEKDYGFRGDVRLLPAPGLTIDLAGEYTSNRSTYLGMRTVPGNNPYLIPGSSGIAPSALLSTPVFYQSAAGLPTTDCNDNNVNLLLDTGKGNCSLSQNIAVSGTVKYQVPVGTFVYIGGYRKLDQGYINQYDASNTNKYSAYIIADNGHNEQMSHEVKFNGDFFADRVHLVTGVFFLRETTNDRQTTFNGGTTSFHVIQDQHLFHKVETAAVYGQADFDLTDKFVVTAGGRYTWERKNLNFAASAQFNAANSPTSAATAFGYTGAQVAAFGIPLQQTQRRFTPRIAVSYKLDRDVLFFASATNGFKSGGWNGGALLPQNAVTFRPERTWSYESGIKSEFLDHRLRVNATAFLANTKDLQVTALFTNPFTTPPTNTSIPFNAGTQQVYGLEVESSMAVTNELSLFANPSAMRGKFTYVVPTSTVFSALLKPQRVPKFQFNGGANYMVPVASLDGSVGGSATWRHNSPYFISTLDSSEAHTENFVDLALKYEAVQSRWGLSFEVSNLTNQKTVTANFLSLFPGDPRRFTARLKMKI